MEIFFTILIYALSLLWGWLGWNQIINYRRNKSKVNIINGISYLFAAILTINSSNWTTLFLYLGAYFIIPLVSTLFSFTFLPILFLLKNKKVKYQIICFFRGSLYGSVSILLYFVIVMIFRFDYDFIVLSIIFVSCLLNNLQRIVAKEDKEKENEKFIMSGELISLIIGSTIILL